MKSLAYSRHGILCLMIIAITPASCAMKIIKPKESKVQRLGLKNKAKFECLLIAKKKNREDHFAARFNHDSTTSDGELYLKKALIDESHAKKVILLSASAFRTEENQDLRFLAAQMGCGKVFSYQEKRVRETSLNFLSIFYPTLVGLYIFPGTNLQLGVQWDIQILDIESESPLVEGQWYGTSKLYMFRPGSYDFMTSHAYREAVKNTVKEGLTALLRESIL